MDLVSAGTRELGRNPEPVWVFLVFSFKYFQEFDGVLTLPPGFKPRRLRVTLQPEGGAGPVEEAFDWARALASG